MNNKLVNIDKLTKINKKDSEQTATTANNKQKKKRHLISTNNKIATKAAVVFSISHVNRLIFFT